MDQEQKRIPAPPDAQIIYTPSPNSSQFQSQSQNTQNTLEGLSQNTILKSDELLWDQKIINAYIERSSTAHLLGKYQEALDNLVVPLNTTPYQSNLLTIKIDCHFKLKNFEAAIHDLDIFIGILEKNDDNEKRMYYLEALNQRSEIHFLQNNLDQSLADIDSAIDFYKTTPSPTYLSNYLECLMRKSYIYEQRNQIPDAQATLKDIFKLKKQHPPAHALQNKLQRLSRQNDQASYSELTKRPFMNGETASSSQNKSNKSNDYESALDALGPPDGQIRLG